MAQLMEVFKITKLKNNGQFCAYVAAEALEEGAVLTAQANCFQQ